MNATFEFFYCCPDDPWLLSCDDQGYPNSIEREWLDAIHRLTGEFAERQVRLTDFAATLYTQDGKGDLYIAGWGFKQQCFSVTPEDVARIHADTSPERLNELERQGREEWNDRIAGYERERQEIEEGLADVALDAMQERDLEMAGSLRREEEAVSRSLDAGRRRDLEMTSSLRREEEATARSLDAGRERDLDLIRSQRQDESRRAEQ